MHPALPSSPQSIYQVTRKCAATPRTLRDAAESSFIRLKSSLFVVLLLKDFYSHIIDSGVIEHYETSVGTRFDMHADVLAELIVDAAEIVANGLNCEIQLVGDTMGGAVGQTVFESAKLIEGDCLAHSRWYF